MSDNLATSLFQPSSLPQFAEQIGDKYLCVKCKSLLTSPVKQTQCGHRLCSKCVDEIVQAGTTALCPGGEEECVDISLPGNILPDFGTERELKRLQVYCSNKGYGCQEVLNWAKLDEHVSQCQFTPVDCPNHMYGCPVRVAPSKLPQHRETCRYKPSLCRFCGKQIAAIDMERGHEAECAQTPKECKFKSMGCTFKGTGEQLATHIGKDHQGHIELLMRNCAELQLNETKLRSDVQELKNENDMLKNRVEESSKDVKKIKTNYEQKIRSLQKITATNAEKLIEMEKLEEPANFVTNLQDLSRIHESRINQLEAKQGTGTLGMTDELRNKIKGLETSLGRHDVRLAEYDLRFQCLETANYNGTLIWKIRDYRRRKDEAVTGRTLSLYSQPFYSNRFGYKMCARVYLNGDGMGKGSHISLFFVIMRGDYDSLMPWPFRQKVTMTLLDQDAYKRNLSDTFRPDPTSTSFKRPTAEMNVASGCPLFATQSVVESTTYLKDDTIFIKVSVDITDLPIPH